MKKILISFFIVLFIGTGLPSSINYIQAASIPTATYKLQNFESYKEGDIVADKHSIDISDIVIKSGGYNGSKAMNMFRSAAGTGHNSFFNETLSSLFGKLPVKTSVTSGGQATDYFVDYSVADGIMFYIKNLSKKSETHTTFLMDFMYDNKGKIGNYRLNVGLGAKVFSMDGKDVTTDVIKDWFGENYFYLTKDFEGWVQIPTTVGESSENVGWRYAAGAEVAKSRDKLDLKMMSSFTFFLDEGANVLFDEFSFYGNVNIKEDNISSSSKSSISSIASSSKSSVSSISATESISGSIQSSIINSATESGSIEISDIENNESTDSEESDNSQENTSPKSPTNNYLWIILGVIIILCGATGIFIYLKNKKKRSII